MNCKYVCLSLLVSSITIGTVQAQQIPDRSTLDSILGANQIFEDFESFDVAYGGAVSLDVYSLDDSTIAMGQGPGLVEPGAVYSDSATSALQWNGDNYYSLISKTLLSNGANGEIDIDYTTPVNAMGLDLRAFAGYGYTGTVDVYDLSGNLVSSTGISLSSGGTENVFFGWQHAAGISSVVVRSSTYGWSPLIDNHGYGTAGFSLTVEGNCPGKMNACVTQATPNARIGFAYGFREGSTKVPPCPGLSVDIGGAKLAGLATADANGDACIQGNVPQGACGRVLVQAVDLSACATSNVVGI